MPVIVKILVGIGLAIASFIPGLNIVVGMMMFGMGTSMALGGIAQAIRGKPNLSSLSSSALNRTVTVRQPLATGRVVYGVANLGGVITYLETTGTDNEFLHMVLTLGAHELASIGTMQFDGVDVPLDGSGNATGTFAGLVHVEKNLGTREQAAFAGLVSASAGKWTTAHRQRGRPGVYVRLKWDQNKFPNGAPNITFDVTGRAVRDPRTTTIAYSRNSALCLADYLMDSGYGLGALRRVPITSGMLSHSGLTAFDATKVTNGNLDDNAWHTDSAVSGAWLKVDLGAGKSAEVVEARIFGGLGSAYAGIYDLEYSDDGSAWTKALVGLKPNVTGKLGTPNKFRVPYTETVLTPLATENFNRANENPIATPWIPRVAGQEANSGQILSNQFIGSGTFAGGVVYDGGITWPDNQYAQAKLKNLAQGSGYANLELRRDSSGVNGYQMVIDSVVSNGGTGVGIVWIGIWTMNPYLRVATLLDHPISVNDVFRIGISGNLVTVYQNGTAILAYVDPSPQAGPGKPGLDAAPLVSGIAGDIVWDDFEAGALPGDTHRYWRLLLTNTPGAGAWLTELQLHEPILSRDQLTLAAITCDEDVALAAGGTEKRYETDGAFDTSERPADAVTALAGAMGGFAVYVAGKFSLYPGAWREPNTALTFSDDDLAGPLKVTTRQSRRDIFNTVRGTFVSAAMKWQPTNFPTVSNSAYVAEDDGEVIYLDAELPFTISNARAQRIAKLTLERVRRQVTVQARFKFKAYKFAVCDVIKLNHPRFGWTNKMFEVQTLNLVAEGSDDGGIALFVDANLRETDADVYAWNPANDERTPSGVSSITVVGLRTAQPVTSLAVAAHEVVALDGSRGLSADLTWTAPADQYVTHGGRIHVYFKLHTDSGWTQIFTLAGAAIGCRIGHITSGVSYDYRVTAENTAGVFSTDTDLTNQTLAMTTSGMLTYRPLADPLSATDAGASATINVASFTMRIQGVGDKSINSGSITGLSFNTLYYVYYDDAGLAGGAVTYQATTTKGVVLDDVGRFFVGSIQTPRDGGIDTIGNNDGGNSPASGMLTILTMSLAGEGTSGLNASVSNVPNVLDYDINTKATVQVIGSAASSGATLVLSGPAGVSRRYSSVTLKVVVDLTTNTISALGGNFTVFYTLNGLGGSPNSIVIIGPGGGTLGRTLYSVSLSPSQNLSQITLAAYVTSAADATGQLTAGIYAAWIEATE